MVAWFTVVVEATV